jgi:PII-like signaling protein
VSSGGVEGFGRGSAVHTNRLLDLSGDLLVAVMIVDEGKDVTVGGPPGGNRPG